MTSPTAPHTSDQWQTSFDALSKECKDILCFLAIHAAPLRKIRIRECCSGYSQSEINNHANCLIKDGWCELVKDGLVQCKEQWRERIVHNLVASGKYESRATLLFVALRGRHFTSKYSEQCYAIPQTSGDILREFRHNIIVGDTRGLSGLVRHYVQRFDANFADAVKVVARSYDGHCWLTGVGQEIRSSIFQHQLVVSLSTLTPVENDMFALMLETASQPKCDQKLPILLLDYALFAGKLNDTRLDNLHGAFPIALLAAHRAFVAGDYSKAAELYQAARQRLPGTKTTRNAAIPYFAGIFQCLCELHVGHAPLVLDIAQTAIKKKERYKSGEVVSMSLTLIWPIVEMIAAKMSGVSPAERRDKEPHWSHPDPVWFARLLEGLELVWLYLDSPEVREVLDACKELVNEGLQVIAKNGAAFPWLAAEAADVAVKLELPKQTIEQLSFGAAGFRKISGTVSLTDLIKPRDEWEIWLESLKSLVEDDSPSKTKSTPKTKRQMSRLVWRVDYDKDSKSLDFEPYEQTLSAKGTSWSVGRPVALSRLCNSRNSASSFLTEQDQDICSHIRAQRHYGRLTDYYLDEKVAFSFIGHPLLFQEKSPQTRVELVAAQPEITMEAKGDSLHLAFSPPLVEYKNRDKSDDSDKDLFTVEETPTRYKIIKLSRKEMQIRRVLGTAGRVFPKHTETSLAALLGKLVGDVAVKTDAKIDFSEVPEVPCDSKLYLYLAPSGDGLQADFFVRPLGIDGPGHRPGSGSERVLASIAGKSVQTVRNIAAEKKRRENFVEKFPSFQTAAFVSNDQYLFETPQDALSLLSEIKDAKESDLKDFEIFWPQGESFAVTATAGVGNMSLSFASAGEWLEARGLLTIGGEVFELQRLFELLDDRTESRFVKLDDKRFISLTNEFRKRLGELKRLAQTKGKTVQLHPLAAAGMEDFFDAIPSLRDDAVWKSTQKRIADARNYKAPFPKDFVGDLRDYQLDGYAWLGRLAKWGVGCCLADDMGLGKTIQALAMLLLRASQGPALVVAPTSVCFNWEREAAKFAPTLKIKRVQPITPGSGLTKDERDKLILSAKKRDVLITSYSLLQQEIDLFSQKEYATVVLDESQAIKNPDSNRAKAACQIKAGFRIGMTGTPIENNLVELWSLFRFLNPGLFGSQKSFEECFAIPIQRDSFAGARGTLRRLVHPFILRRTKSQVLDELPPRTEILREIELSAEEASLYEAARMHALSELQKANDEGGERARFQILAALTRLRQLCCNPRMVLPDTNVASSKLEAFREIMQELKENRHRVLVFSQFVKHLDILKAELDDLEISYQYLDGSTPVRERQKQVDAFQDGESDAFLISIKAGGSGLNLTAADYVIHTDPWWNPAVEDQATDRAHRIGQTRPVTVYRLITKGTIEEKIVRLHHEKRDLADKLLEGTDQATTLSADDLIDILRS